jgi:hypothetical protein
MGVGSVLGELADPKPHPTCISPHSGSHAAFVASRRITCKDYAKARETVEPDMDLDARSPPRQAVAMGAVAVSQSPQRAFLPPVLLG